LKFLSSRMNFFHFLQFLVTSCNAAGRVHFVLELRIANERFRSSSDLIINGPIHYPDDVDGSLGGSRTRFLTKVFVNFSFRQRIAQRQQN
jgi:hypothetical protein